MCQGCWAAARDGSGNIRSGVEVFRVWRCYGSLLRSIRDYESVHGAHEPGESIRHCEFVKFSQSFTCSISKLSNLSQADEFKDLRFRAGEKSLYKELNRAAAIRYPIKVDLALAAHKTSLVIQAELGGVDYPSEEQYQKYRQQYTQDRGTVFQHVHRLIRCLIDCKLHKGDSVSVRNGLELFRSLAARVWDNSPLQLKQVDQLGAVAVRKLVVAGITSIKELLCTDGHRIEMILSRHPPFGSRVLAKAREIPDLKVEASVLAKVRHTNSTWEFTGRLTL